MPVSFLSDTLYFMSHENWIKKTIELAKTADKCEVPIAAIIVKDGQKVSSATNSKESHLDPTAHAEINAIRDACQSLKTWRLSDCQIYINLEPCVMCAGAIIQARISEVYFAAYDKKGGGVCSCTHSFEVANINHRPKWQGGILEEEASGDLKNFFKQLRAST